jgi:hypothetical protein
MMFHGSSMGFGWFSPHFFQTSRLRGRFRGPCCGFLGSGPGFMEKLTKKRQKDVGDFAWVKFPVKFPLIIRLLKPLGFGYLKINLPQPFQPFCQGQPSYESYPQASSTISSSIIQHQSDHQPDPHPLNMKCRPPRPIPTRPA